MLNASTCTRRQHAYCFGGFLAVLTSIHTTATQHPLVCCKAMHATRVRDLSLNVGIANMHLTMSAGALLRAVQGVHSHRQ